MSARAYIPYGERLAAALACLLPQQQRDQLRADRVGSEFVLSLFQFDHIELHAFGGSDLWWNLDPKPVAAHREKSARDTGIVAKAVRITEREEEFRRRLLAKSGQGEEPAAQRKRRWGSRPFPKGRKMQSRGFDRGRT